MSSARIVIHTPVGTFESSEFPIVAEADRECKNIADQLARGVTGFVTLENYPHAAYFIPFEVLRQSVISFEVTL